MTISTDGITSLLLDHGEVPPVLELNETSRTPFIFICDHFGNAIPRKLGDLGLPASERERHIAWDIGIAGVATRLATTLGAHLIAQRYSRLVIDCNRPFASASSIPLFSEATTIPGNEGLSADAIEARQREIFQPYHERIGQVLDERARTSTPTLLVSLHSFTPVYAGITRPWHVGTLYQHDTRLPPLLLKGLRSEPDLVVGDNEPYAVSDATDYSIPVHGEARGLMNTGIEIRQDLIAHEAGQAEWAERLSRVFGEIENEFTANGSLSPPAGRGLG